MARKLTKIDGVRLKYRTTDEHVTASVWVDDECKCEMARIRLDHLGAPGSPGYQGWVDATSAVFSEHLSKLSGVSGITTKRQRPSYKGE